MMMVRYGWLQRPTITARVQLPWGSRRSWQKNSACNQGAVKIAFPDTDTCCFDAGSQGSRTTHIVGRAAITAAAEVREKIFAVAAGLLQADISDLELAEGKVGIVGAAESRVPLGNICMAATYQGKSITGSGCYMTPPVAFNPECATGLVFPALPTPTYHVHLAEVDVDTVTW